MRSLLCILCLIPAAVLAADDDELAPVLRVSDLLDPPTPDSLFTASEASYLHNNQDALDIEAPDIAAPDPGAPNVVSGAHDRACGQPGRWWMRAEYLSWWTDSMDTPPLVTTSPQNTPQIEAGRLPAATILYGGRLLDEQRSGGRILFGHWLDDCRQFGWEADYLALETITDRFFATSTDPPILARPFFNALTNAEDAQLVSFDPLLNGSVGVEAEGDFQSAGARMVWNACCSDSSNDCQISDARIDLLLGYRFIRLDESIAIRENLTALAPNTGTFDIMDRFETRNEFHGAEIGVTRTERYRRWSLNLLGRLAFGNARQTVRIDGSTTSDDGTGPQQFVGGLLAQRTNIGEYVRNRFALAPELGVTLGCDLTQRLKATVGYSLIYWDRVVRAGDQIDREVNPNLLPPEVVPFTGPLRPAFEFEENGFWAQGLNVGLTYVW